MRAWGIFFALLLPYAAAPAAEQTVGADPRVQSALELVRAWAEAQRAYERIPGISAAIVHDQELLWAGAYGTADLASGRPASAGTQYSIASISKLFTSIAVMQQRDAGKVRLDDPVERHLPWFRLRRTEGEDAITLESLLTHSSGLPRESDYGYWTQPEFPFPTREQIVEKVSKQDPLYAARTTFQYSNLGLTLVGEVVAATSGMPYAEYMRRNVLGPLGLRSTVSEMQEADRKRLAAGYAALDREGKRAPTPFFSTKGMAPAAGYVSTAEDLARFAMWQFRLLKKGGQEVLKATTLREMYRVHWMERDLENLWGLGFQVSRADSKSFVGHGGSCPGFRSRFLLMPEERVGVVFLSNAGGVDSETWSQRMYDIVAPAVRAAVKEPGKGKAPPEEARRYAGSYNLQPWHGETVVVPWEDGLALLDIPTTDPFKKLEKFKPTGPRTFRLVRKDDSLGEEIVFEVTPGDAVKGYRRHSNFWPKLR